MTKYLSDEKLMKGKIVDGRYKILLKASDLADNKAVTRPDPLQVSLYVDTTSPEITGITVNQRLR